MWHYFSFTFLIHFWGFFYPPPHPSVQRFSAKSFHVRTEKRNKRGKDRKTSCVLCLSGSWKAIIAPFLYVLQYNYTSIMTVFFPLTAMTGQTNEIVKHNLHFISPYVLLMGFYIQEFVRKNAYMQLFTRNKSVKARSVGQTYPFLTCFSVPVDNILNVNWAPNLW